MPLISEMNQKLLLVLIALIVISSQLALADVGPKPSADIHVKYNGNDVAEKFEAKMLVCIKEGSKSWEVGGEENLPNYFKIAEKDKVKDCTWRPARMAWGGNCQLSTCGFTYMLPKNFRVAVYLPSLNKVFISDSIVGNNFNAEYLYEINENSSKISQTGGTDIHETTPIVQTDLVLPFILALVITLVLELVVAFGYLVLTKKSYNILISVVGANLISLPIVWFLFPMLQLEFLLIFAMAEVFAILFEGYFIHFLNKKTLSLQDGLILSAVMNIGSLLVGGIIVLALSAIFYL